MHMKKNTLGRSTLSGLIAAGLTLGSAFTVYAPRHRIAARQAAEWER